MSTQRSPSRLVIAERRLSPAECRHTLNNHHEGRLGYSSGRGPRSVVVNYRMTAGQIVVRLPDYNDIVHYAPGAEVTFQVEAETAPGVEAVRVRGTAALVGGEATLEGVDFDESWPAGVSTSLVSLPLTALEGYERSDR